MAADWKDYQEEAAALFRSVGFKATTDVTLQGVRTTHNIDVVVNSHHAGFDITWLVECKYWKIKVSKLHVLALREIVSDLGADRGILLCEVGFQSGAVEAANLTNVQVTSLEQVRATAGGAISAVRLRELFERLENCKAQYWDIPKDQRIDFGLRNEVGAPGYNGENVIKLCVDLLSQAFRGVYPFHSDTLVPMVAFGKDRQFVSAEEVLSIVSPLVEELEQKLSDTLVALSARKAKNDGAA